MSAFETAPITSTYSPSAATFSPSAATFSPTTFTPAGGPGLYPTTVAADPFGAHERSVNYNEQRFLAKTQKREAKRAQKNSKIANKDWSKSERLYAKAADLSARGKEDRAIKKQDKAARLAAAAQVHQTASTIAQQEVNRNSSLQAMPGFGRSFMGGRSLAPSTAYMPSYGASSYGSSYGSIASTTGPIPLSTTTTGPIIEPGLIYYYVPGSNDLSFADLKQILAKYSVTPPKGAMGRLFELVEKDTKGRMSQATVASVENDLASLVADFRRIDTNNNNTLSRKELREYYTKLGEVSDRCLL
eukprot:TRINITY_DN214_c0_g1_i1.p1 TRINITY_DN214_c0_g1~~TRINITY_DN214_c0_g1_i1.p1  ORF type:complete len:328 (-),score=101.90 TRINITY_DN214_c0_g1_i1:327-1232(-)